MKLIKANKNFPPRPGHSFSAVKKHLVRVASSFEFEMPVCINDEINSDALTKGSLYLNTICDPFK
jgi:hypothetical protein